MHLNSITEIIVSIQQVVHSLRHIYRRDFLMIRKIAVPMSIILLGVHRMDIVIVHFLKLEVEMRQMQHVHSDQEAIIV